jgi:formate--tetrahydrofolate ligase
MAQGTNTAIATRTALKLSEIVVTEAGFGMDLGGEKFFDILCAQTELRPAAVVLVATVRALKLHGGQPLAALATPDRDALRAGLPNLLHHVATVRRFGPPCVVAINRFPTDTQDELDLLVSLLAEQGVACVPSDHYARGGAGARALAEAVVAAAVDPRPAFTPL